jgi:hypothetical protein
VVSDVVNETEGRQQMRSFRLALAALVLVGLSGCVDIEGGQPSSAEDGSESSVGQDDSESTSESGDDESDPTTEPEVGSGDIDAEDPCSLLGDEDFTTIFGQSLGEGRRSAASTSSQGVAWSSERCAWGEVESLELALSVADAESFEDGLLQCLELPGIVADVTPVSGI